jgi:hypothetical protein
MRRLAPLLFSAALAAVVPVARAHDHHSHDDDGFTVLFDGETLDGWEQKNGFATYKVEQVDGAPAIVGRTAKGSPNSFLCTEESYGDFVLEFEVKLLTNALNSGVQIRSRQKATAEGKHKEGRVYGPQVEIEKSPGDSGYLYGEATSRGWLVPMKEHVVQDAFKNGEWNRFRVVAEGANIKTYVNGTPVADLTDEDVSQEGFIGLQVHSFRGEQPGTVMWRNVRIKSLD